MSRPDGPSAWKRRFGSSALPIVLISVAAIASSGFVHESVQARRMKACQSLRLSLARAMEESRDEAWRRPLARWRGPLEQKRRRGEGYGRSHGQDPAVARYDFSAEGEGGGVVTLLPDVVRTTLRHHDARIGGCLMRHGAGSVDIQFEVQSDGRLSAVRLDLTGAAEQCVRGVLSGVRFPSRPGGPVKGSYQLRIQ